MLTYSRISTEALYELQYQKPPNLATELEKVFERVIQYKKDNKDKVSGSKLVKLVNKYFYENEAKNMLKVIETYTGMKLSVEVSTTPFINFAICWHFGEYDDPNASFPTTAAIAARYCGQVPARLYEEWGKRYKGVKTQEELVALSKTIMKDKSAIKAGMFEKYGLKGKLYFCPFLAFSSHELFGGDFKELTAAELAAIICHECGHAITFIVHAMDLCYKKEILYNGARTAFLNFPMESKSRIIMNTIKKLYPDKYEKFSSKLKELKEKGKNNRFSPGWSIFYTISALFALWFTILSECGYIVIRSMIEVVMLTFGGYFEHASSYDKWGKASDFAHQSMAGNYYEEELADEYVSKMGYTHHLTTALNTIEKDCRFFGTKGYHNVGKVDYFFRLLPWLAASLFTGYREDYIHPAQYKREENAMMDIIKAFKSDHMDPRLIDDYYKAFMVVKKLHDSSDLEKKWEKANKAIEQFIEYVITTPYNLLISGRFQSEYDRLFNQAQSLMHNQLYALSYGLKQKAGQQQ